MTFLILTGVCTLLVLGSMALRWYAQVDARSSEPYVAVPNYKYREGMERSDERFHAVSGEVQRRIEREAAAIRENRPPIWLPE